MKLKESEKNRKLNDLLDALEFNQVVIFVSKVQRATELNRLLDECNFPSMCIHSGMKQDQRISMYKDFKDFKKRILVRRSRRIQTSLTTPTKITHPNTTHLKPMVIQPSQPLAHKLTSHPPLPTSLVDRRSPPTCSAAVSTLSV